MQVNILEAKNRLSQLIKSAQAGEEVVIANRGEPVARLVLAAPEADAALASPAQGSGVALCDWLQAHPLPAHRQCRHDAIEATIAEARAAWD